METEIIEKYGRVINTLPEEVRILSPNDEIIKIFPAAELTVGVTYENKHNGTLNMRVPLTKTIYKHTNLPPEEDGVFYIVSHMIFNVMKHISPNRKDLLVVCETVKDLNGKHRGCRSLGWETDYYKI